MKIVLIPHLKIRLKERKIPQSYPKVIIQNSEEKYKDLDTGYDIVVKNMEYNGKLRPMVVAYAIMELEIQAVTIYPTSRQEIENKLKRGRWAKNEED
ncbi:MAG: hypothetical protein Q8P92_05115 [Candidatus Daviesbacteria bacterium]|nr:hypothetical protein [Candidatus Daviesbacteria bacterium]